MASATDAEDFSNVPASIKIYKWKIFKYFWKAKICKLLYIFALQKIISEIDAEALKISSASVADAIVPNCWTYNILSFDLF